jgi:ligand-binding sensor protein
MESAEESLIATVFNGPSRMLDMILFAEGKPIVILLELIVLCKKVRSSIESSVRCRESCLFVVALPRLSFAQSSFSSS